MANAEHVALFTKGVLAWGRWRQENPNVCPDLSGANLSEANLIEANLSWADLSEANLIEANLSGANLSGASLSKADLYKANLPGANLSGANLFWADLSGANLSRANLIGANLSRAGLTNAQIPKADLSGANLAGANLSKASLSEARLIRADLCRAILSGTNFHKANLSEADLSGADLHGANLSEGNLSGADLHGADLTKASLFNARLFKANLSRATLVKVNFANADLTGGRIFGVSAWKLKLEGAKQESLIITDEDEPEVTVDNIEVAQFIYLLLNNEKIRDVIDTIGKKGVLILGRFTGGRIAILERLREKLRDLGFVPMVFNFDKPETKDFTETVRLLAGLSHFVITDLTDPKSVPLELQAVVPDTMIPIVPILENGDRPFSMLVDLQNKHDWVLDAISYSSVDRLVEMLETEIVRPAEVKFNELLARRTKQLRVKTV